MTLEQSVFLDMEGRADLQSFILKLAAAEHRPFG
jgi:hypothetical protein